MGLNINTQQCLLELEEQTGRMLARMALYVQAQHTQSLRAKGNPSPHDNPAPKGTYPAVRSAVLSRSVVYEPTSPKQMAKEGRVRIGLLQNAFYGEVLAGKGWKGLLDTMERVKPQLMAIGGQP